MMTSIALAAQLSTGPFISAADLKTDFQVLGQALTTIHGGLYRYQTPAQFETRLKALEKRFENGGSQSEVFLALSEFTAAIKCGHTFPSFWNQPDGTHENLFMAKDKLPVAFRWVDRKMIVTRNDSESAELQPGTEIKKINGQPAAKVLDRLLKLVKGDGGNDAKRIAELQIQDQKKWEAFDVYYTHAFHPTEQYSLEIESLNGKRQTISVPAIDQKTREANRAKHTLPVVKDGAEWGWSFPASDTAMLNMPTWALYNSKWDWKAYIKDRFVELKEKGTKNLILDVRGNAGGNECGDEFLRYLVDQKVSFASGNTFIRYTKIPSELRPYISTWDREFYDWSAQAAPKQFCGMLNSDAYQIRGEDSVNAERGGTIEPAEPRFRGNVYVLVDAECSSATFQFATQVRQYKVGTLIGAPTGGNRKGINGGAIFFTTLPKSRIEIDIPIIAYLPSKEQPDQGLTPDFDVRDTREDIAKGLDRALQFTLNRIAAGSGTRGASGR
jgi:C-terminal processing protease CtpA/Prc